MINVTVVRKVHHQKATVIKGLLSLEKVQSVWTCFRTNENKDEYVYLEKPVLEGKTEAKTKRRQPVEEEEEIDDDDDPGGGKCPQ